MNLHSFLDTKPLFYDEIDYGRFPRIYKRIQPSFKLPKIIHIVGTNGKGTTGRFLAHMLRAQGIYVGHYTSPHILNFNERIWLDGNDVSDKMLEEAHTFLLTLLNKDEQEILSYFEYTTLLAMVIFSQTCDYVVLEAGLGGEFDATHVFTKNLSIITPIGYDHQAFLGNTIEEIATTKLNSIETDFILAPQPYVVVECIAQEIAKKKGVNVLTSKTLLSQARHEVVQTYVTQKGYPTFLHVNFTTAYSALTFLGYDISFEAFDIPLLAGRFQKFLPNVTLDVGHNPLAAEALLKAFGQKKVILVYNSYADKEYASILELLKPIIEHLEVIEIQSSRAVDPHLLRHVANGLGIAVSEYTKIDANKEYLVFGSFSVIEAFLKGYRER